MANVATAEAEISASPAQVWVAPSDPSVPRWRSDCRQASSIVWKGEFEAKSYQDKGQIVEIEAERRLNVTHVSPLSGLKDVAENYHTLIYELEQIEDRTHI